MIEKSDVKEALESIMGHQLHDQELQLFEVYLRVASHSRTNEGITVKKSPILGLHPKICEPTPLLDVSGSERTGNDGKKVFQLTNFVCLSGLMRFAHPINVLATALSSKPFFLTILHSLVKDASNNGVDVEIQVSAWDFNGAPAPDVSFNWRCRVGFPLIPL